jgi:hypothetical protein
MSTHVEVEASHISAFSIPVDEELPEKQSKHRSNENVK